MDEVRVVLDTSVLVVGIASRWSSAARVLRAVLAGDMLVVSSRAIEDEWVTAFMRPSVRELLRKAGMGPQDYINAVADIRVRATLTEPTGNPPPCRDERDRIYLHCAQFSEVPCLVTVDRDLLEAPPVPGCRFLPTEDFIVELHQRGRPV